MAEGTQVHPNFFSLDELRPTLDRIFADEPSEQIWVEVETPCTFLEAGMVGHLSGCGSKRDLDGNVLGLVLIVEFGDDVSDQHYECTRAAFGRMRVLSHAPGTR